jgi:hypothetical protein
MGGVEAGQAGERREEEAHCGRCTRSQARVARSMQLALQPAWSRRLHRQVAGVRTPSRPREPRGTPALVRRLRRASRGPRPAAVYGQPHTARRVQFTARRRQAARCQRFAARFPPALRMPIRPLASAGAARCAPRTRTWRPPAQAAASCTQRATARSNASAKQRERAALRTALRTVCASAPVQPSDANARQHAPHACSGRDGRAIWSFVTPTPQIKSQNIKTAFAVPIRISKG